MTHSGKTLPEREGFIEPGGCEACFAFEAEPSRLRLEKVPAQNFFGAGESRTCAAFEVPAPAAPERRNRKLSSAEYSFRL